MSTETTEAPATRTITLLKQDFEVQAPFAEGHTITAAEAKTLNQCRAENIGNNFRKRVKTVLEMTDEAEQKKSWAALRKDFKAYDAEYQFSMSSARTALSPLEKETVKVARTALLTKLKKGKVTLKAYTEEHGEEYVRNKVQEIAEMQPIIDLAKKNLKEAQAQAEAAAAIEV